jgi:hypothetical protein
MAQLPPSEQERELWKTPDALKDNGELDSSVDDRPTARPGPSLSAKLAGLSRFGAALRHPDNAAVAKPFILASVALFVGPVFVFSLVFHGLLPLAGLGDIPIDQSAVLGMDRVTFSGVCALVVCWAVMIAYTVFAMRDDKTFKTFPGPSPPAEELPDAPDTATVDAESKKKK